MALAVMGPAINAVYCDVISPFPGTGGSCINDEVVITEAKYHSDTKVLHIDATSNGVYDPTTTLTVSPGGVMVEKGDHYHLEYSLPGCPCQVTVTSSAGGAASVNVGG